MSRETLHLLLEKYLQNQCTAEEKLLIEKLYGMLDKKDLEEVYPDELIRLEQKLWDNISQQAGIITENSQKKNHKRLFWYAAAVISALTLVTAYLFFSDAKNPQYLAFRNAKDLVEQINTGNALLKIRLEDGSVVVLQPRSSLSYPHHFKQNLREVSLQGEAYFLISKNPKRPFFVYNKNTITRVVGTSFIIRTNRHTEQTEVIVRTGKVMVYPNVKKQLFSTDSKVILTPNQKTAYSPDKGQFETSLVPDPVPLVPHDQHTIKNTCSFEDTPIPEVLKGLQQAYGIEIIIADHELNVETFTGDISGQSLYKKLDLICHAVKARYEISGTRIMIREK